MLIFHALACVRVAPPTEPPPPPPPRIGVTGTTPAIEAAIRGTGGVPVAMEPGVHTVDGLDALVLGPGLDLDPALYGERPHTTVRLIPPERQDQDLLLARDAWGTGIPVLGICLGAQELAVWSGGALLQDIPSEVAFAVDHRARHTVHFDPESPFHDWYGATAEVDSNHHQAAKGLSAGLTVGGRSEEGVIEAFWRAPFVVGVQFHPEHDLEAHGPLWTAFVEEAASGRRTPRSVGPPPEPALERCAEVRSPLGEDRTDKEALRARVGSGFGDYRKSYVKGHKHAGVDLKTDFGEPVYAICEGRVADIHLGFPHRTVVVEHHLSDGSIVYSSSKHLEDIAVSEGDRVTPETRLGRVFDAAEQKKAPWVLNHLHFEMRSSIEDEGAASWTSMSMFELEMYAFDPVPFLLGP